MTKPIEKIKKLLALSESSNEHEAKSAMLRAQELMVKHKLSMQDVSDISEESKAFGLHRTQVTFTGAKWKAALANVVANNFLCEALAAGQYGSKSHTVCFVGSEDDLEICIAVYNYAIDVIKRESRKIRNQFYKAGESGKGVEQSYAFGFTKGLSENYAEQRRSNEMYALVLQKDPRIQEAIDKLGAKDDIPIKGNVDDRAVAFMGYMEGRTFSMQDRLADPNPVDDAAPEDMFGRPIDSPEKPSKKYGIDAVRRNIRSNCIFTDI